MPAIVLNIQALISKKGNPYKSLTLQTSNGSLIRVPYFGDELIANGDTVVLDIVADRFLNPLVRVKA